MVATYSKISVNYGLVIAGKAEWFGITSTAEEIILEQIRRSTRDARK